MTTITHVSFHRCVSSVIFIHHNESKIACQHLSTKMIKVAHVKIPILDEGDGVTRNAQFEELKDKEIMSFLTYKYTIHRSTKPDDYGAVMSTFDDYPYFGTFRIYETWEISLKDSLLYFYSPSHLYNEKLNRDYFTVECVLGIVTIQEFIFNLKFQSQFEEAKPGTSIDKRKKRSFYTLLDPGSDTPHLIRKHLPALDFVCSYLDESSGIMITQYTTVIDIGSSGAFVVSYYSNCASRNREVYEKFMEQSSFVKTENLPWTDIELFDGIELKIPFGFKVGSESGIVFLFSPIQQCYQDVICDNFMIQLLVTDSSLVKVATSIQNQFREKKQLELVEDLELIDLELGSTLIYGYRFEVKFVEEIKGSVNTRNVSQLVVVFNGVDVGQKFVFTYTSTTGLPCRSLFLQMIETFSS